MIRSLSTISLLMVILVFGCRVNTFKTEEAEPLLVVAGDSISAAEFLYAFNKNNRDTSGSVNARVRNYLDLYIDFKLKVTEGRSMMVDTTEKFKREYKQYKSQLVKPYLLTSQVSDSLVSMMYDRTQKEIKASHILITVGEEALPQDTLKAYNKILELKNKIEQGADFGQVALEYSEDPSAKINNGELGYFTAFQMVEPFEDVVYNTSVGEISDPVRTRFGYHIVKVEDVRKAQGKVLIAHIYKKADNSNSKKAEEEIREIYKKLEQGEDWDELTSKYSEDIRSKDNGGRLQWFGTGQLDPEILDPAFQLEKPGDYTKPIKSRYGWHIVKLIQKQPVPSLEETKRELKIRLANSSRMKALELSLKDSLKKKFGFRKTEFFDKYSSGESISDTVALFYINKKPYNATYLVEQKLAGNNQQKINKAVENALEENEVIYLYETNSDFKFLLDEYSDGMVLFEVMEREVWDKANKDSTGLYGFYEGIKDEYIADESARLWYAVLKNKDLADSVTRLIENDETWVSDKNKRDLLSKDLKSLNVVVDYGKFDRSDYLYFRSSPWQEGLQYVNKDGYFAIIYIEEKLSATNKPLSKVRGEVVSRYQKHLEEQWLDSLREKYEVIVNEELLQSVINELEEQRI
ncbi:peptidylprolyl isomerase [Mangrovivirga sp. M17]|uniref:Peptidylprolyl isomerase n=1 Tax=Mangrovivirga halotolerans TaxID=2993936 RepID=A0ABT3RU03_9BACT|nr:peptidylprolyl isomerase [Mangrovivirga halotolerans]MCX2744625.1 peptidylprolyl isomerase [Mangrovivirga halotolerans]